MNIHLTYKKNKYNAVKKLEAQPKRLANKNFFLSSVPHKPILASVNCKKFLIFCPLSSLMDNFNKIK